MPAADLPAPTLARRKAECIEIIAEHDQALRDDPNCDYADILRDEIKHERKLLEHIRTVIKD